MINFSFKLDPSLRQLAGSGSPEPADITVFVSPEIDGKEEERLVDLGLIRPAVKGDGWSGRVSVEDLILIAALPGVGYISNAEKEAGLNRRTPPRYRPPAPAKRGHTKLPPRRD